MNRKKPSRRTMIQTLFATAVTAGAGLLGISNLSSCTRSDEQDQTSETVILSDPTSRSSNLPYWSEWVEHNGLVYVAGKGVHFEGDITDHTTATLNLIEEILAEAGSSMDNVLKVNVYLDSMDDYEEMNEAYLGRFGDHPPVRTTIASPGGIPGSALVEIDCIATLKEA